MKKKFLELSFETRKKEGDRILSKYPDRIPIIIFKNENCTDLPQISKTKFLVPLDLSVFKFNYTIRNYLELPNYQAFVIFNVDPYTNTKRLMNGSSLISEIYSFYKAPDGFLYMEYQSENTFG
jgi:GABA(A) receptor-associated protein